MSRRLLLSLRRRVARSRRHVQLYVGLANDCFWQECSATTQKPGKTETFPKPKVKKEKTRGEGPAGTRTLTRNPNQSGVQQRLPPLLLGPAGRGRPSRSFIHGLHAASSSSDVWFAAVRRQYKKRKAAKPNLAEEAFLLNAIERTYGRRSYASFIGVVVRFHHYVRIPQPLHVYRGYCPV